MVVNAVDQAGNTSDAITIKYYVDQKSPDAPSGGVDQPKSWYDRRDQHLYACERGGGQHGHRRG